MRKEKKENRKVFKGIDKQLNKRIVTNCIIDSILLRFLDWPVYHIAMDIIIIMTD